MVIEVPFSQEEHFVVMRLHHSPEAFTFKTPQEVAALTGLRISVVNAIIRKYKKVQ